MNPKKTGYDFWNDVLGSPQYVAAPMVDMSELAFRTLCRRYGTQLCFSQMFHSQQFFQDSLYRSDIFSTSPEDRPLIVQFCANDPTTFVSAAAMVSSQCDGIDLNLGCPQSIAKKGHYGAFLQDEWDLIRSMVQKASYELPVPVTCKMRVLPGPAVRSVEYAKMLEHSGCSVLTVHGRTRFQKGHATGLASWDVIKEIKENLKIPVIANGNILSFDDVHACLEYTGADAVMSAEGLLHNPGLFSGANPPVWEIAEEYLSLAKKYATPLRNVRNHMFRILYLCLHQDVVMRKQLEKASTFEDFQQVCSSLRTLPFKVTDEETLMNQENELDGLLSALSFDDNRTNSKTERCSFPSLGDSCLFLETVSEELFSPDLFECDVFYDGITDLTIENCDTPEVSKIRCILGKDEKHIAHVGNTNLNNGYHMSSNETSTSLCDIIVGNSEVEMAVKKNLLLLKNSEDIYLKSESVSYLPIWLCHSRPRIAINGENRGNYRRYFRITEHNECNETNDDEDSFLSKRQLRKARHHSRVLAAMKDKRKTKKLRRKQKLLELRENISYEKKNKSGEKVTKKQQKESMKQRLLAAQGTAPKICIDLFFSSQMTKKELSKLSSQLRRLYGSNRHSENPLHLYFCNLSTSDSLYEICVSQNEGFPSYVVEMKESGPEDMFLPDELIYLTPDSENALNSLDNNKVYVIGGIVDGAKMKGLTLGHAANLQVQTARLPILEQLERCGQKCGTTVLTVNQVFDVLLKLHETGDWIKALSAGIPHRKGFRIPDKTVDGMLIPQESVLDNLNTDANAPIILPSDQQASYSQSNIS